MRWGAFPRHLNESRIVAMRRPFAVAILRLRRSGALVFEALALGALLTLAPAAAAQRGGGGHAGGFSGGHASGFGGGFSGRSFSSGFSGRSFGSGSPGRFLYSAPRSYATAPRMTWTMPARGFAPGYRTPYRSGAGAIGQSWAGRGGDHGRYRSPYRGYGGFAGYPYGSSWELTPWDLGYPDFLGYGNDIGATQPDDTAQQAPAENGYAPDEDFRQEYGSQAGDGAAPFTAASEPVRAEPQITLIFADGHRQTIRNYALTSDAVFVLDNVDSGRQQRIPLSELNLPATEQAAQQAGLDFTPPA